MTNCFIHRHNQNISSLCKTTAQFLARRTNRWQAPTLRTSFQILCTATSVQYVLSRFFERHEQRWKPHDFQNHDLNMYYTKFLKRSLYNKTLNELACYASFVKLNCQFLPSWLWVHNIDVANRFCIFVL